MSIGDLNIFIQEKMSKTKVSSMMYDFMFAQEQKARPQGEESSEQRFIPFEKEILINE